MSTDVMISWLAPALCHTQFANSLVRTLRHPVAARIGQVGGYMSGPLIAQTRTTMVDDFLTRTTLPWLLTIDSDMVFEPEHVSALIDSADQTARPIVGGLYAGTGQLLGQTGRVAEAGHFHDDTDSFGALMPETIPPGLVPVDYVGAGFLLVHRTVFEHLATIHPRPQPWFSEVVRGGRVDGEDWEFCRRATSAGYPIHVNADVRVGHLKTGTVWPNAFNPTGATP